jgi:hypothetical protein
LEIHDKTDALAGRFSSFWFDLITANSSGGPKPSFSKYVLLLLMPSLLGNALADAIQLIASFYFVPLFLGQAIISLNDDNDERLIIKNGIFIGMLLVALQFIVAISFSAAESTNASRN